MRVRIRQFAHRVGRAVLRCLGHRATFYATLAISVLQALWYAFSFRPIINDEAHHFRAIEFYTHHISPFVAQQANTWDSLGALTRDGSYLFYYLLSWPLRFVELLTANMTTQVIALRLLCLIFFVTGLVLYRRALLETKLIPVSVINLALLCFVITPAAGLLGGMISYDNLMFLLFAGLLLVTIRIVVGGRYTVRYFAYFILLAGLLSITKWSAIALVVPAVAAIGFAMWRNRRVSLRTLRNSLRTSSGVTLGLLTLSVIAVSLLVIERPIMNLIKYGKPNPNCAAVLGHERCMSNQTYVSYYRLGQHKSDDFHPNDPGRYFFGYWLPTMTDKASNLVEQGRDSDMPIIKSLHYSLAYICLVAVLLTLRELLKANKTYGILLFILLIYAGVLFAKEYAGYVQYGVPVAIRARYLVPVLPIALSIGMIAVYRLAGRYKTLLLLGTVPALILMFQGGSIVTQLFTAPPNYYWQDGNARAVNTDLRKLLDPVIYN